MQDLQAAQDQAQQLEQAFKTAEEKHQKVATASVHAHSSDNPVFLTHSCYMPCFCQMLEYCLHAHLGGLVASFG